MIQESQNVAISLNTIRSTSIVDEFEELLPKICTYDELERYVKAKGSAAYNYYLYDQYDYWDDTPLVEIMYDLLYQDGVRKYPCANFREENSQNCRMELLDRTPDLDGLYYHYEQIIWYNRDVQSLESESIPNELSPHDRVQFITGFNIAKMHDWLLRASKELDRLRLEPLSQYYILLRDMFFFFNQRYKFESKIYQRYLRSRL